MSYLAFLSLKGVNINRTIKIVFYTTFFSLFFLVLSYMIDVFLLGNKININIFYNGRPRHSFYMNHPNMFAGMAFWTICEYMYLKNFKADIKVLAITTIFAFFVYEFTLSRTMIVSIVFLIVMVILYNLNKKYINNIIRWMAKYSFIILTILFVCIVKYYPMLQSSFGKYIEIADVVLSKRISMGVEIYNIYGVSILPQKVNYDMYINLENSRIKFALDNIYLNCAIVYGYLETMILGIILYLGNTKNNKMVNYLTVLMLINGITESYILNYIIAFPMLLIGNEILNMDRRKENEERINISDHTSV